jgi:hypothetical protein
MSAPRPSTYLNWVPSNSPSYITQPTSGQLTTGWVFKEAPPFQYMNWVINLTDQWIQYLDNTNLLGLETIDLSETSTDVPVGSTLFHPNLIIDTTVVYTIEGSLISINKLVVLGSLTVTGSSQVL